jgi:hypothetical protein
MPALRRSAGAKFDRLTQELLAAVRALQRTGDPPQKPQSGSEEEWSETLVPAKKGLSSAPVIEEASPRPQAADASPARQAAASTAAAAAEAADPEGMGRQLELFGNQLGRVAIAVCAVCAARV